MLKTLIEEFHRKLSHDRVNNTNIFNEELVVLYKKILEGLSTDFDTYRTNVPLFLSSLESNNAKAVPLGIDLFMRLQTEVVQSKQYGSFDLTIMDFEADDETVNTYLNILAETLSKNNQQRISESIWDLSSLSPDGKRKIASLLIQQLQEYGKTLQWNKDMVENTALNLVGLRQLLIILNNLELFYHVTGIYFDRLVSSELFQLARDIAEEINISAFKDNVPEFGFFNSFRVYSNLNSVHAGLMYSNLSLICAIRKGPPFPEKYVQDIIWQSIKFFRNVHLSHWATEIYHIIPEGLFLDYEKRSLDHTYFSSLLYDPNSNLPSLMLDYLNQEREAILQGGIHDAQPWLLTLYNIRRLFPLADFSLGGLGFYLNVFETIVPPENVKKQKEIIEGDSSTLKEYLIESLIKLNETRNATDFVYDNESAIKISNRSIKYCIKNKDSSTFLLAMLLKSDYSILFKSKEPQELAELNLPDFKIDSLNILYDDAPTLFEKLSLLKENAIIWIAFTEGEICELMLVNNEFSFYDLPHWSYKEYKSLIDTDYFVDLSFEDTIIDRGSVREISPEEYTTDDLEVKRKLSFNKIEVTANTESLFLVKDMELSKYPHNLFLNMSGDLIAKKMPVTNILSTEWFLRSRKDLTLSKSYSKSIWIPTESSDYALNYLYSNIEETINDYKFDTHTEVVLASPLSSDINIICSHGGKNISELQIMSQKTSQTYDLNTVIGPGKVLVFFVCYSGSMKTEFFRNNVTSLVKRFISKGYSAVVAPFWALDVTIPRYWLPEFLKSLDNGLTIDFAVHKANMKVYEKYSTPAAWACLHLYGNPYLKVD